MDKEQLKREMDEDMDYQSKFIYITPFIKFNGRDGKFILIDRDQTNEISESRDLGNKIQIVFLRKGRFKLFNANRFTNEGSPNQKGILFNLYETIEDNKGAKRRQLIKTGEWSQLKLEYSLKTQQLPFVLLMPDKKIAKMKVIPSSLGVFWDYWKGFKGDERPYEYITEITCVKEKSPQGMDYWKMVFERKELVENLEEIAGYLKTVKENVEKEEKSFGRPEPVEPVIPVKDTQDKDIPVIETEKTLLEGSQIEENEPIVGPVDLGNDGDEDIDVSKIPF